MKITKLGHCCLLIEDRSGAIITDPGAFSTLQNQEKNVDLVIITHEHQDHFHIESVKVLLQNNPELSIVTNSAVGALLDAGGIKHVVMKDKELLDICGMQLESFESPHAVVYDTIKPVLNSGFLINDRLLLPGDSFHNPGKDVEILALPTAGPWMKLSEAVDYARGIKPKKWFAVHDAISSEAGQGVSNRIASGILAAHDIEFIDAHIGESFDI